MAPHDEAPLRTCRLTAALILALMLLISAEGLLFCSEDSGQESDKALRELVANLSSPFFIVRDRSFKQLADRGRSAAPFLLEGLESENAPTRIGCLRLLDRLIHDNSLNSRVMELAASAESGVAAAATHYLAAHPDEDDPAYAALSRSVLAEGTALERTSYLDGIGRPAPGFQAALVLEALPGLPAALRPEAVRALARAERGEAARCLEAVSAMVRSGVIEESVLPHLLDALEECVTLRSLDCIVDSLTAASPLVHGKAVAALTALRTHFYRLKRYDKLIALNRRLCALFPEDAEFALDLADALVLHGDDPGEAAALLEELRLRLRSRASTNAVLQGVDAQLGLAFAAFRAGRPWKPFLEDFPADLERTPGDYCAGARARILLLRGALTVAGGGDGRELFMEALATAPYEPFNAIIDGLLLGRFSVTEFMWRLSRDGDEKRCREIYAQLLAAMRGDPSRCNYFPDAASLPSLEDRSRSRLPLWYGNFLRQDLGNQEKSAEMLTDFIDVVHQSTLWNNLDLAALAFLNRAAAEMQLGDHARAEDSARNGIKISEDLLSEYKRAQEKERLRAFEDILEAGRRQKARGLLQLATANTMRRGDPERTAALVDEALGLAPELVEVRMAFALVLAREGKNGPAAKIVASVEDYPDQFYNKACALLLLGREEEALDYLARHFAESVRPLGRKRACEWALDDPDLDSLKNDPRFLKLVGAEK
jgi:tetratricopeptide (TPR) repeat protein